MQGWFVDSVWACVTSVQDTCLLARTWKECHAQMYEAYLQGHTDAYVSLAHEFFVPLCTLASGKQSGSMECV